MLPALEMEIDIKPSDPLEEINGNRYKKTHWGLNKGIVWERKTKEVTSGGDRHLSRQD